MILIVGQKKGNIQINKHTSNKSNTNAITHRKKGEKLKKKKVIKNNQSRQKISKEYSPSCTPSKKNPIENKNIKKIRSCVKKKTLQKKGITLNKQNLADKLKW